MPFLLTTCLFRVFIDVEITKKTVSKCTGNVLTRQESLIFIENSDMIPIQGQRVFNI